MERRARLLGLDYPDGLAERAVPLEHERLQLMAYAFRKVLDSLQLDDEQQEAASRLLMAELRAAPDPDDVPEGGDV